MKIKDLLRLLEAAPDNEKEVLIPAIDGERTTFIGFDFDDINNIELYETDSDNSYTLSKIDEIEQIKKSISAELDKIATIEIDYE